MVRLFPYPTLVGSVDLRVSAPTVDGTPEPIVAAREIGLWRLDRSWSRARIEVTARVPVDELGPLGADDLRVIATVNCAATNLRTTTPLEPGDDPAEWRGVVTLDRALLLEQAQLTATVVGTVEDEPHRFIGRSDPLPIPLREPRHSAIPGGSIVIRWRDFAATEPGEAPVPEALRGEVSWLDVTPLDGPVLYLNDGIDGLRRLLDERPGRNAAERAAREAILDGIAVPAIVGLVNAAVDRAFANAAEDDGAPEIPSGWEGDVLRALLPHMFPETSDPDAAFLELVRAADDPDVAADRQSRIVSAAGRFAKVANHTRSVINALAPREDAHD